MYISSFHIYKFNEPIYIIVHFLLLTIYKLHYLPVRYTKANSKFERKLSITVKYLKAMLKRLMNQIKHLSVVKISLWCCIYQIPSFNLFLCQIPAVHAFK